MRALSVLFECSRKLYIVGEGDPVTEMLFIIREKLESSTPNGGRTGFFMSITLRPGDFCGEELLAWALLPKSTLNFPSSTRTVRALEEVEAFALRAEDLKFVANQFRRLHSKNDSIPSVSTLTIGEAGLPALFRLLGVDTRRGWWQRAWACQSPSQFLLMSKQTSFSKIL